MVVRLLPPLALLVVSFVASQCCVPSRHICFLGMFVTLLSIIAYGLTAALMIKQLYHSSLQSIPSEVHLLQLLMLWLGVPTLLSLFLVVPPVLTLLLSGGLTALLCYAPQCTTEERKLFVMTEVLLLCGLLFLEWQTRREFGEGRLHKGAGVGFKVDEEEVSPLPESPKAESAKNRATSTTVSWRETWTNDAWRKHCRLGSRPTRFLKYCENKQQETMQGMKILQGYATGDRQNVD